MRMPRKTPAAARPARPPSPPVPACARPARTAAASAAPAPADISDAEYLAASAQANLFEIATGKEARKQGKSATVRMLGRMFVKDHTAALAQGAAVAKKLGVTPPTAVNPS